MLLLGTIRLAYMQIFRKTISNNWYANARAYQGIRNVSFFGYFEYVLKG